MTDTPTYAPGTPSWVDLGTSDVEGAKAFYSALFGWEAFTFPDPAAGGYGMFLLNGKQVAGVGPLTNRDQPSAWSTYIATDDANSTADAVRQAGGRVVVEPMDVFDAGRMAVLQDPTGAHFCAWQAGTHTGAEVVNQTGSFAWNELYTRDLETAKAFYNSVFGWEADTHPMGEGGTMYTEWKLNDRTIGGAMDMNTLEIPSDVPPHWLTYFVVDDCDASVAKAQELGATVVVPTMDIEPGRFSILFDPQGAVFAVFSSKN